MMCIFLLAKDVFGGRFIRKKETFAPEIVQTYDLERRTENDQFNGDIPKE
jgi:hypothetical protein